METLLPQAHNKVDGAINALQKASRLERCEQKLDRLTLLLEAVCGMSGSRWRILDRRRLRTRLWAQRLSKRWRLQRLSMRWRSRRLIQTWRLQLLRKSRRLQQLSQSKRHHNLFLRQLFHSRDHHELTRGLIRIRPAGI